MNLQINKISNKTYNIVTYNIAGNKPSFNLYNIVNVLKPLNADVICLQEVCLDVDFFNKMRLEPNRSTQAHAIAHYLGYQYCIFGQTLKDKYYGIAIISKLPIVYIERVDLPRGSLTQTTTNQTNIPIRMPGAKEPRLALCAIISPIPENADSNFIVICTHFGLYNSHDIETEIAKMPISIISNYINHPKFADMPTILAGDLNIEPDNNMLSWLAEEWIIPVKNTNTFIDKDVPNIEKEIDYIATRHNNKIVMSTQNVVINEITKYSSDHFPLVASISM